MTHQSNDPDTAPDGDHDEPDTGPDTEAVGAEVGMSDGEGTTFEPEEDPEGHDA